MLGKHRHTDSHERFDPVRDRPQARPIAATFGLLVESLAGAKVSVGQVYYDYTPANLLFENDQLSLVDPPDVLRQGVLLWDFSCFRSWVRRHLWRFSLRRPFDRRRAMIKEAVALFQHSYLANCDKRHDEPALFAAATLVFELQRTAVLLTMQKGKVDLANRITLPLLEMEKRWLFLQLARELL